MNERNDAQAGIPPWLQVNYGAGEEAERAQDPHTQVPPQYAQPLGNAPQPPQHDPQGAYGQHSAHEAPGQHSAPQAYGRHDVQGANDAREALGQHSAREASGQHSAPRGADAPAPQGGSSRIVSVPEQASPQQRPPADAPYASPEPAAHSYPEPQLAPPQQPWFDAPGDLAPPQTPAPAPHPYQAAPQPEPPQDQPTGRRHLREDNEQPFDAGPGVPHVHEPSIAEWAPPHPQDPGMPPPHPHLQPQPYNEPYPQPQPYNEQHPGGHPTQQGGSTPVELTPPVALDQRNLVNPVKAPPKSGWRKFVHTVTGGKINPGSSRTEREEDDLLTVVRTPLRGDYRIAVMSLKGGVGKTTTTVALGGVFASERGDRVIAIDANPDLGTLAQRTAAPGPATIRDLLAAEDTSRYPQVKAFTTQADSRLEVIGSERDPAVSEAFSESDYRRAIEILQHHYNVILTDCGTGLMHSAMAGVLDLANSLVLVTSSALDGAQSASATLDWLVMHGYEQLAANSVVVLSSSVPGKPTVDINQIVEHFRSRTRAVHVIPYDRHLAEGAVVDMDRMARPTLTAYRQLAASIAEDFESWHRHGR